MIRRPFLFACLAWIFTAGAVLPRADAQTSVTTTGTDATVVMHVGDPYSGPAIQVQGNPDIVVVPGTKVSYIKNGDYDMYEVGDVWYYRYDGNWYRASDYKGPYTYVTTTTVPRSVRTVPKKYRHTTWTTTTTTTTQTSMSPTSGTTRSKAAVQSQQKARTSRYSKSTRAKRSRAKTTTSSTTSTTSSTTESGMSGSDMSWRA